jgi:DNA primase
MQDEVFRAWLNARGISDETIRVFSLSEHTHPVIGSCIKIPVNNPDGSFSFNKYRRDPMVDQTPKYLYDRGGKTTLYGADKLKRGQTGIVITEGELDTLVLHSLNVPAVSSTGGAMSFNEEMAEEHHLYGCNKYKQQLYLCFDNDDAGAKGMVRTLQFLPSAKIIFIPEQPDVKDISDFVARGGDFHTLMESAFQPTDLATVEEDMRKRKSQWLPTRFHKAYIEEHTPKPQAQSMYDPSPEQSDEVQRAKSYPITNLTEFKQRKACCPYHNEKTPSFHYYPKTNSAYCFGCNKSADSIDIYQIIHNCTFKEAVRELNKLL